MPDSASQLKDPIGMAGPAASGVSGYVVLACAAAFGMQAVYRQDTRQATIVLTITDTTPGIINAILADPRIDHDTDSPPTSDDTSADVTQSPMAPITLPVAGSVNLKV